VNVWFGPLHPFIPELLGWTRNVGTVGAVPFLHPAVEATRSAANAKAAGAGRDVLRMIGAKV
jgi:hypothetical protein